jgi:RNA polymerase sigma-70 factor (ECF subfamily)
LLADGILGIGAEMVVDRDLDDNTRLVGDLYDEHVGPIFNYVLRLVNERDLAEELTQETFARVLAARERLPYVTNRRAWVYRIATNTCFRTLQRRKRFAWIPWFAQASDDGKDLAEEVSQRNVVREALQSLPPEYRAPLLLYLHDGLALTEVAEIMGISEGAVKTRIYRAREMFRRAYRRETAP